MHEQISMNIRGEEVRIDISCFQLVRYFNSIGLDTKYCCEGDEINNYNIMFEDYITDKDIEKFIIQYQTKYGHSPFKGRFFKWVRLMSGEIKYNWVYQSISIQRALIDYKIFTNQKIGDNINEIII